MNNITQEKDYSTYNKCDYCDNNAENIFRNMKIKNDFSLSCNDKRCIKQAKEDLKNEK